MIGPGNLIDDCFEVVDEIGQGGMGIVLRVRDRRSSKEVALKYCPETEEMLLRRFRREVGMMTEISHDHVMPVLHQNLDHRPPYFTMPLAESSLEDEAGEGMSEDEALDAFAQICDGVQAIHNAGGTHRDIKPANAMRMPDDTVVVTDLGLAKIDPRETTTLTVTAAFLGTRVYCAPEQLVPGGSRGADVRTDVFQLGKTLYELVTGEPPALVDPDKVPAGLAYVLDRATRNHPDQRYQSVGALRDAVQNYVLAKKPDASPDQAFEAALAEAVDLAKAGKYKPEVLEKLLGPLLRFAQDHPGTLLQQFDRIPKELLEVMARNLAEELEPVIRAYADAVHEEVGGYNFSYAETVAERMTVVFRATENPQVRAFAVKATLIAAVMLNRFAAMDVFDSLLLAVKRAQDAVAVADVLREEIDFYSTLAERIPDPNLHPAIRAVRKEANRRDDDDQSEDAPW